MSLHGKVAIVTGAAQGIGRAIAESLAQAGADIVVADLDPSRSKDTVAAVEQLGRKALNVKVNVADADRHQSHGRPGAQGMGEGRYSGEQCWDYA